MHILVLGGYGLIGLALTKELLKEGHRVTGLARAQSTGKALAPNAHWIGADISLLTQPGQWEPHLGGVDVVVNASGALQSGGPVHLASLQGEAIIALIKSCENRGIKRFIQISAPGAALNSDTDFYRTKAQADVALKKSSLDWTIFRPGLVISPHAYGGTSLIRMLAAFPLLQPVLMADRKVQTVAVDDVADAVLRAVRDDECQGDFDLLEPTSVSLAALIGSVRAWLGFSPAIALVHMPGWIGKGIASLADLAGHFGWRSPMRTTALKVLDANVVGDAEPWRQITGSPLKSLGETLGNLPSTVQERIYSRAQIIFPIAIVVLSAFWIVSGIIGLWQESTARGILSGRVSEPLSYLAVWGGGVLDVLVGIAILFRRYTRTACFVSIGLSMIYLFLGSLLTPLLWLDPLGSLVKIFPVIILSAFVAATAEER